MVNPSANFENLNNAKLVPMKVSKSKKSAQNAMLYLPLISFRGTLRNIHIISFELYRYIHRLTLLKVGIRIN